MKTTRHFVATLLALLLAAAGAYGQDAPMVSAPQGYLEFGFRGITGTVDGRTHPGEVPFANGFRPDILNSGINTYRDYRNSVYIPRSDLLIDNFLGTNHFFSLKTANDGAAFQGSTLMRDQTVLTSFGRLGIYKLEFRWDQTPHIFSSCLQV